MYRFLYIISGVILFTACSKKDDSPPEMQEEELSIVGTWTWTGFIVEEAFDNNGDGVYSNDFFDELSCLEGDLLFKENGEYEYSGSTMSRNSQDLIWMCHDITEDSGTWSLNGDQLTLFREDGTSDTTPYLLTEETLEIFNSNITFGDYKFVYSQ